MADYGGQDLALDVLTPAQQLQQVSQADNTRAQAQETQTAADLARTLAPVKSQLAQNELTQSNLATGESQLATLAKRQQTSDSLIANAAAHATDFDSWDAAFQGLADQGVEGASQFVGHFSPQRRDQIAATYGASPLATIGSEGGLPNPAAGDTSLDQPSPVDLQVAQLKPDQLASAYAKVNGYEQAFQAVESSSTPAATFNHYAAALGHPELVGRFDNDYVGLQQFMRKAQAEITPLKNALDRNSMRQQLGVGTPPQPAEVKESGGVLYKVQPTAAGPSIMPVTQAGVLVGTDAQGRGVYYDKTTGTESVGGVVLGNKPGTNRQTVFAQKQQAALAAGMSADEALQYANGQREMSPQQVQVAAAAAAARDASTASLSGQPFDEGAARQQYVGLFSGANQPGGSAVAAPPAPPAPGRGGQLGFTAPQAATIQQFRGATAAQGTRQNPVAPTSKAQYDQLKPKTFYIDQLGNIRQKQ